MTRKRTRTGREVEGALGEVLAHVRGKKVAKRKTQGGRRRAAAGPREHLRRLADELPEATVVSVLDYAAYLRDRKAPRGDVEEVDEPLSAEEIADAEAGWRECQEGKSRPIEDVYREWVR